MEIGVRKEYVITTKGASTLRRLSGGCLGGGGGGEGGVDKREGRLNSCSLGLLPTALI
jgi:hypothetical protein